MYCVKLISYKDNTSFRVHNTCAQKIDLLLRSGCVGRLCRYAQCCFDQCCKSPIDRHITTLNLGVCEERGQDYLSNVRTSCFSDDSEQNSVREFKVQHFLISGGCAAFNIWIYTINTWIHCNKKLIPNKDLNQVNLAGNTSCTD